MFKFLKNLSTRKKYQQSVDDWISVLFCGFPEFNISYLKEKIDYAGLIQHGLNKGEKAAEVGLAAALLLFQKALADLSESERITALDAVIGNDGNNQIAIGLNFYSQITSQMVGKGDILPMTERLYQKQMLGVLRGCSPEELTSAWANEELKNVGL